MYKQIYNKTNGEPELVQDRYDEESAASIFDYDKDLYTDFMPPSSLYQPIYFDEELNEWVGTPYEVWKENRGEIPNAPIILSVDTDKDKITIEAE